MSVSLNNNDNSIYNISNKNYDTISENDNILNESNIDIERIISLRNKIISLSKNDMIEVFKIIKNNNNTYTENKNGIFINMNKLTLDTISEIESMLQFLLDKNNNFEQDNKIRKNIKNIVENVVSHSSPEESKFDYENQQYRESNLYNEVVSDLKSNDLSFDKVSVPLEFSQLQCKMVGLSKEISYTI